MQDKKKKVGCIMQIMSPEEFKNWVKQEISREASEPDYFPVGAKRTLNVLKGVARDKSMKRWRSFFLRHGKAYCRNPTRRRAIALRNWGFKARIPGKKKGKKN